MKTILSVDDEVMILECLRDALKIKGYQVLIANDPFDGLEILTSRDDIALAILDIKMPGMTGFELYRTLRKTHKIPVLFLTAYPRSFNMKSDEVVSMWQQEFSDGTTDIMYKPFELEVLFDKVVGLIGPADEDANT